MKTVLHVGAGRTWTRALGSVPWPLVSLGNRPLLEYWFELSVDLGVTDVHLALGEGAEQIEAYVGDGSRWGLRIQYGFLRDDRPPLSFLAHNPGQWRDGLLFMSGPVFPRRLSASGLKPPAADGLYLHKGAAGGFCAVCPSTAAVDALLAGASDAAAAHTFQELGLELQPVESVKDFFAINMQLVGGEISRYLAPGYGAADGSFVGYNVIIPPSAEVTPAVIVGNDCRIGALASVGPCAVIGDHVFIDRQALLERCVVLAGTYVGRQVEIREKIVAASRLIDPEDGEYLDLEDTWLLAGIHSAVTLGDMFRAVIGWVIALLLLCIQAAPFAISYGLIHWLRQGRMEQWTVHGCRRRLRRMRIFCPTPGVRESLLIRLFIALGLDLTPRLAEAVCGWWWLCGHEPLRAPEENALRDDLQSYFPGVFGYATRRTVRNEPAVMAMEARYYLQNRGIMEDMRILRDALAGRLISVIGGERYR